jgi:spore coat protein CotH
MRASGPVAAADDSSAAFFGHTNVHPIELRLSAQEWTRMQPAPPRFGQRPGGPGAAPPAPKSADTHRGGFGMEYPWARGELTFAGRTYTNVALRYKGNFTYMASARGLKRPIKIDFARHEPGQRFFGLKKLNLNNGVTDGTRSRESLSFAVFRAAGVPAPRTAYAEVTLTVPGKYDHECVGLYTVIEEVDRVFLKDHFKSSKGMLLKPEGLPAGLAHLGDDWKPYEQRYRPKGETDKKQQQRLIDFTRLVNQPDEACFRKEIGSYLDVDAFLRFLAANALLANLDSFLGLGHNYYLYLRPDTNQFVFIPWDLDLSMGAFPMGGTPEQQVDLSVMHPHRGANKLIDRLLAMPEVSDKYRKLLQELMTACFTRERLLADIAALEKVTREPLAREAKAAQARNEGAGGFGFGPPGGGFGQSVPPRMFVEKRTVSVAAQLAGRSKGFVPPAGFGPPPQPGLIMPPPLQEQLGLTDEQKKRFAELQKEVDRKVQEILTAEQREQFKNLRPARPGAPPGAGPGRP